MATLVHKGSGARLTLAAHTLVGRSRYATVWLDRPHVSSEHSTISWSGDRWDLKDLGSRNGTFIDGQRIAPGEPARLAAGTTMCFGAPSEEWTLEDASPPVVSALDMQTGTSHAADSGLLSLPPDGPPEQVVYQDARGIWVVEPTEGEPEALEDLSVLTADGRSFRISLPIAEEGTPLLGLPSLDTMSLRFEVPRHQEHVKLTLQYPGGQLELEPREHGFLLLLLARARLEDRGAPSPERGWIDRDELARMVGVTVPVLHVLVHRSRLQLAEQDIPGAPGIIDVRRRERRIGVDRIEIVEY